MCVWCVLHWAALCYVVCHCGPAVCGSRLCVVLHCSLLHWVVRLLEAALKLCIGCAETCCVALHEVVLRVLVAKLHVVCCLMWCCRVHHLALKHSGCVLWSGIVVWGSLLSVLSCVLCCVVVEGGWQCCVVSWYIVYHVGMLACLSVCVHPS